MFWHWITSYTLLFAAAILVFLTFAASWLVGTLLIMPAHRKVVSAPSDLNAVDVSFASQSGAMLKGWWCENPGAKASILLLHGVRGDRRTMLGRARLFRESGFSVLLIDFQAHGESRGSHITFGYLERHDVSAAIDFVRSKNQSHPLGIVGSSLGGAATLLGAPRELDALVLEAVYPTIEEAIEDRARMRLGPFGFILTKLLLLQIKPRLGISPTQLRPIDKINEISCPILITAGDKDRHTTLAETERLYSRAPQPKELVIFKDAAHVDLLDHDRSLYVDRVVRFFQEYLLQKASSATTSS